MSFLIEVLGSPLAGSTLGILGLIAAMFFYWKGRRVKRMDLQSSSVVLVGEHAAMPSAVEIHFLGSKVPRVTATRIVLWNSGNQLIEESDILQLDPLRLELPDGEEILQVTKLRASRDVNGFALIDEVQPNKRLIHFDFLEPGDGIACEILHTGQEQDLKAHGTVKGLKQGLVDRGPLPWKQPLIRWTDSVASLVVGVTLMGLALFASSYLPADMLLLAVTPLFLMAMAQLLMLWRRLRLAFPRELDLAQRAEPS